MSRYIAVEGGKNLKEDKEYINYHGVGHYFADSLNRLSARIEFSVLSHDKRQNNKECRAA